MKYLVKNTLIAFLLIAASAGIIIFTFGNKENLKTEVVKPEPQQLVESLSGISTGSVAGPNVTEALTSKIAQALVDANPTGPQFNTDGTPSILTTKPEDLLNKTLSDAAKNFKPSDLRPQITSADIQVSADTSKAAQEIYFALLRATLAKNLSGLSMGDELTDKTDLASIVTGFDNAAKEVAKLTVPQNLSNFQIEELTLLGAQKNLYAAIANYQVDPARALLATQAGETITQDVTALRDKIIDYILKNKLSV